jgi:hypothetical protein
MLLKAHCAVLATLIAVAAVLPASAQGFDKDQLKRAKANLPDIGRPYSIRVTTGGVQSNAGFEQALTQSDPNLKHWCWIPVSSMKQAYIHVGAGQAAPRAGQVAPSQRPTSVYVKPVKVALPKIDHGQSVAYIGPARSNADVSAKVSYEKPQVARTYEGQKRVSTYSDCSGRLTTPRYTAANYGDSRDVYGKLISRSTTH